MYWKSIAIRAFFGGIGFAIGVAAIAGAAFWYSNRPKQWNTKALKATYNTLDYGGQSSNGDTFTMGLQYNVQNNSKQTYEVNTSSLTPMAVLTDGKALSKEFGYYQSGDVTIDAPPFIPPGGTARITVHVTYSFPSSFSQADRDDFRKVVDFMDARLREVGGIVVFDSVNHYQIVMPDGWSNDPGVKEGTQPIIDPSLLKKKTSASELSPCPSNDPLGINSAKPCQPPAPTKGAPPCPAKDPLGLDTKTPCTPLPGRKTTQ